MNKDLIISPERFAQLKSIKKVLLIDLAERQRYQEGTVPGAVNMFYAALIAEDLPHPSMLPPAAKFAQALAQLGYAKDKHIVAFDDEFGLKAARLYWTMRMADLRNFSYLNGGLASWLAAGNERAINTSQPIAVAPLPLEFSAPYRATYQEIRVSLAQQDLFLWDTRSRAEWTGEDVRAKRGGHIPGAHHLEWVEFLDDKGLIRPAEEISPLLEKFTAPARKNKQPIVAYCQAHRRSSMAFLLADFVGIHIKGYDGSWQEWGNKDESLISTP